MKKMKKTKKAVSKLAAADLCDEIVMEIITRLPLKHAFQCKTLNKTFNNYISHPTFNHKHTLLSSSTIHDHHDINNFILFYSTIKNLKTLTKFTNPGSRTIDLPRSVLVLASCNGLLLLSIGRTYFHQCVFNPITGEALAIHHCMKNVEFSTSGPTGLVVDMGYDRTNSTLHHPFKLVMTNKIGDRLIRFEVIVPSGSSTSLKSRVDSVCESFTWLKDVKTQPVYLNGALHWLENDFSKILVFDVEKEHAKIIEGPVRKGLPNMTRSYDCASYHGLNRSNMNMWFGLAQGSLSFIYTSKEEITIHAHDYSNNEWQIRHKIANIFMSPIYETRGDNIPMYFDGEKLVIQMANKLTRGKHGQVYVHKISTKKWEKKKGVIIRDCHWNNFVPFLPTFAKVFDSDQDIDHPHINYKGLKVKGYWPKADDRYIVSSVTGFGLEYEFLHQLQKFLLGHR